MQTATEPKENDPLDRVIDCDEGIYSLGMTVLSNLQIGQLTVRELIELLPTGLLNSRGFQFFCDYPEFLPKDGGKTIRFGGTVFASNIGPGKFIHCFRWQGGWEQNPSWGSEADPSEIDVPYRWVHVDIRIDDLAFDSLNLDAVPIVPKGFVLQSHVPFSLRHGGDSIWKFLWQRKDSILLQRTGTHFMGGGYEAYSIEELEARVCANKHSIAHELNATAFDYFCQNPHRMPESWKPEDENLQKTILFWNSKFLHSNSLREAVRCFTWQKIGFNFIEKKDIFGWYGTWWYLDIPFRQEVLLAAADSLSESVLLW